MKHKAVIVSGRPSQGINVFELNELFDSGWYFKHAVAFRDGTFSASSHSDSCESFVSMLVILEDGRTGV